MKPSPPSAFAILLGFWAGFALLLTGCASTPKNAAAAKTTDGKQIVLSEAEYEYIYVTGSNIPARVPKTAIARPLLTSSPVRVISPEDFEKWVQRGQIGGLGGRP